MRKTSDILVAVFCCGWLGLCCQPLVFAADDGVYGHRAAHGGALNVIEACEIGHAETLLDGDTIKVWLVGGDGDTETAVRVGAGEIPLLALADGGEVKTLVLAASPLPLAEEALGDCSHFTATAPWLEGVKEFVAVGVIRFKGATRTIRINYPDPYDPDDE